MHGDDVLKGLARKVLRNGEFPMGSLVCANLQPFHCHLVPILILTKKHSSKAAGSSKRPSLIH